MNTYQNAIKVRVSGTRLHIEVQFGEKISSTDYDIVNGECAVDIPFSPSVDIGPVSQAQRLPRGLRNNNPLNIRHDKKNHWLGLYGADEAGFCIFHKMWYGYRAALILFRNYADYYGCETVEEVITRWAPPTENDTEDYIEFVCDVARVTRGTKVLRNNVTTTDILIAMTIYENGKVDDKESEYFPAIQQAMKEMGYK